MEVVMISQPMAGKTEEEIKETRERAKKFLEDSGYQFLNSKFDEFNAREDYLKSIGIQCIPLYFLGKALERMSSCNAVYFCKGWEEARGCRIEHMAAEACGLKIIYEREEG